MVGGAGCGGGRRHRGGGVMATTVYIPAADPAVRRSGIGSSDAATVAGLNRWKTPLDLYLEKRGLVEPEPASEAAEWGTILEPTILREFARRNGLCVVGRAHDGPPDKVSGDRAMGLLTPRP